MVALLVALVLATLSVVAFEVVPVIRARRGRVLFPLPASSPEGIHGALAPAARDAEAIDDLDELFDTPSTAEPEPRPRPALQGPRRAPDVEPDADAVLQALIDRVRSSKRDMVAVVSEVVDQGLDTTQVEAVLRRLVERRNPASSRNVELTLSGDDVPARPGRLNAFGDMPEVQKRRVIIRVLCLLIAQADEVEAGGGSDAEAGGGSDGADDQVIDLVSHEAASARSASIAAGDVWVDVDGGAGERRLPMRRPLARSRS